jgi:hypothetical protein
MNDITRLTPAQLRQAADIQEQIESLKKELEQVLGAGPVSSAPTIEAPETPVKKGRKRFNAKSRAKMAAAQKARWAAKKGVKVEAPQASTTAEPKKKKVSEALLKALEKAREVRAAKLKAEKGATKAKAKILPAFRNARSEAAKASWAKRRKAAKSN